MGCSSCGKPKTFGKVKVTSSYNPKPNTATKFTDVIMNFTIEKESNVSRQDKKNT